MAHHRPGLLAVPESLQSPPGLHSPSPKLTSRRSYSGKRPNLKQNRRLLEVLLICLTVLGLLGPLWYSTLHHGYETPNLAFDSPVIDVVGLALKPSCVSKRSIQALNLYLKPRTIHVVTTSDSKCEYFTSFASNVVCHLQDDFLPTLSTASVAQFLQQHHGVNGTHQFKGRELSGWYAQQFVKLGAVQALPELSEYFVVWDLDMILLKSLRVLVQAGQNIQTVVNIGGAVSKGYVTSYWNLMKRNLEFASDGTSFVTHWMVVYKPYMLEFLGQLASVKGDPQSWIWAILASVDKESVQLGFSEYASYISWVKQTHPASQKILPKRTWVRHPFGEGGVKLSRHFDRNGCCCPSWFLLSMLKLLGFTYTGFEVGHISVCGYNLPTHELAYGL